MRSQYLAVVVVIGLFSGFSHADSIYAISGQLSISGNNVCGSSPCNETINFSFELDNGDFTLGVPWTVIPGTTEITSSGPLGLFAPYGVGVTNQHMGFFSGVAEIDINRTPSSFADPFGPPSFIQNAYIYSCFTTTCIQDFSFFQGPPPQLGIFRGGPAEVDVIPISEGSGLGMLGVTAVAIFGAFRKKMFGRPLVVQSLNPSADRPGF